MKLKIYSIGDTQAKRCIYELEGKGCVVGRTQGHILISDNEVSDRHAMFYQSPEGKLVVRDLESRNGTHMGAERITERTLRVGQEIRVGNTILLILDFLATDESQPLSSSKKETTYDSEANETRSEDQEMPLLRKG